MKVGGDSEGEGEDGGDNGDADAETDTNVDADADAGDVESLMMVSRKKIRTMRHTRMVRMMITTRTTTKTMPVSMTNDRLMGTHVGHDDEHKENAQPFSQQGVA